MKNLCRLFGIIALAAIIGFSMTACPEENKDNNGENNKDNNGGNDKEAGTVTGGTFTLTGIPSQYNGKYAVFFVIFYVSSDDEYEEGNDLGVVGCQSLDLSRSTITASLISNGSVSLPMWTSTNSGISVTRYSGNDTVNFANVMITNPQTFLAENIYGVGIALVAYESVTFSNGSASRTWSQGEVSVRAKYLLPHD